MGAIRINIQRGFQDRQRTFLGARQSFHRRAKAFYHQPFTWNRRVWLYNLEGGEGLALNERPAAQHQKELGEPAFSVEGQHHYYSRDASTGGAFEYAQDFGVGAFQIERRDLLTGETTTIASGSGGVARPEPSPDGRYLGYVARERGGSVPKILDLTNGSETTVAPLDRDAGKLGRCW